MRRKPSSFAAMIVVAAALLLLISPRECRAWDLLDFAFDPNGPTVLSVDGTLTYDSSTGELRASLTPLVYGSASLPGPDQVIFFSGTPQLTIDFFVNPDGTFDRDGAGFELVGTLSLGGTEITGTLLTGSITAFGADPAGPPTWALNGLFDVTGGLLTAPIDLDNGDTLPTQFPLGGRPGGFVLFAEDVVGGTLGDFSQDFSSDSVKGNAGATIPEPSSWALGVGAIGVLLLAHRRMRG